MSAADFRDGRGSTWSAEEEKKLRAMWGEGFSCQKIGERLGRTKNSVVGRAHRLGLPSRPSPVKRDPNAPARKPRVIRAAKPGVATLAALASVIAPLRQHHAAPPASVMRPVIVPPVVVQPRAPEPVFVPVAAEAAGPLLGKCSWPVGEARVPDEAGVMRRNPEFRFCDAPCSSARSYCAEHHARAFVVLSPDRVRTTWNFGPLRSAVPA